MMDSLYFIQFACFIFMLINALILGITHLHMIPFNHPQIKKIGTSINFYFYLNTERILTSTDNPVFPTSNCLDSIKKVLTFAHGTEKGKRI